MESDSQLSDLRAAFEWFVSLVGKAAWVRRRARVIERIESVFRGLADSGNRNSPVLVGDNQDKFGWHLFLCEAYLDHPRDYEPMQGSRVIPTMIAIGRNLLALNRVSGAAARATRLAVSERSNPDAGLFELLTAACYVRNGWSVRFITEAPPTKTHDFEAARGSTRLAVECKRLSKSSDYAIEEGKQFWRMWPALRDAVLGDGLSVGFDIVFHSELVSLPDNFLEVAAAGRVRFIIGRTEVFSDGNATIWAWPLDGERTFDRVRSQEIMSSPGRFKVDVLGIYERHKNFTMGASGKHGGCVAAAYWTCDAPTALTRKARYVLRHVAEAVEQLPAGALSTVHVGLDSLDGDMVEAIRYGKILESLRNFNPKDRRLDWIYVHLFVPECPPNETWAIDETVYSVCRDYSPIGELEDQHLILPESVPVYARPHWVQD